MSQKRVAVFALVSCGFLILFWDVLSKLVHDWGADENYSHGFLVIPLVGYAVWRDRFRLAAIPAKPAAAGLLVILVSYLTLVVGKLGVDLFLTRVAALGMLAGLVVFLVGWRRLKALGFPFLILALAVPLPAIILNQITFPLQLVASRFGEYAIAACQIPVLREGNVITLASTSLEVAEACSGIRSLAALMTLAIVWGYFTDSPMWLRWLLAAAAVPISIFANGIRVAGTGVAAHFLGPSAAQGFFHTFSGWLVFIVAGILMLAVHRAATLVAARVASAPTEAAAGHTEDAGRTQKGGAESWSIPRGLVAFGCLVFGALVLGALTRTETVALKEPLATVPLVIGPWDGRDQEPLDRDVIEMLRLDEYLNRVYRAPGGPWVGLYVGYYRSQRQGQVMHSPLNCMPGSGWQPTGRGRIVVAAPDHGSARGPVEVNRMVVQKGLDRQLVIYWYQARGRIVASEYWGKVYGILDGIRLNRSDGALVRVIVPIASQDAGAEQQAERTALEFVKTILPVLSKRLDG